jgi:lambda family phage portal protein
VGILGSIFGGRGRSTLQATVDAQKAALATMVRAKYDAAQTSDLNRNHWASSDHLSADASLQPAIRQILRNRARYELRNNSYAAGIASTWSNDLVGTGPRLQLDLGPDVSPEAVRSVENAVSDWADTIDLAKKLRISKTAKISDGEVFGLKTSNRRLRGVQLDLKLVEADQVMSPAGFYSTEHDVDGVRFDADGNVTDYWISRRHPGSLSQAFLLDGDWIDSNYVCHWYHATRPGQHRGVPEIAPALELFALLRRYTLAVVTAAETAASFAAILKTTMPADGSGAASLETLETMPIVRGMAIAAPDGWEPVQMRAEHPTSSHDAFVRRLINEIAAALGMPYIVASLDSSSANYSSMRGDYLVYRKRIAVERSDMERTFLDPLLYSWLDEAVAVPGLIPRGLPPFAAWNWTWVWDGFEHVDPLKEADADAAMVGGNMASLAEVCAKRGRDWRVVLRQRSIERQMERDLGVSAQPGAMAADDDMDGIEAEDGYRPPQAARDAARRGLELRREYGRGGTAIGVARARDIANGRSLSLDTIGRMVSFFARHSAYKENHGEDPPSNAEISWLLWGGDAGRSWAEGVYKRENEDANA